jgi:ribosomal protein S21
MSKEQKPVTGSEVIVNCRDPRKHVFEVADALKEFKKKIKKDGLMQELRRREHYVAPSKARRLKRNESLKQRKRDEKKVWQKPTDF